MNKKFFATAAALALTMSMPAMAADLLVSPGPAQPYVVHVEGQLLDLSGKSAFLEGEVVMVPVRAVGEALGYQVEWTAEHADQVRLDNGTVKTAITLGADSYYMASSTAIGMSKPSPLGAAPAAVDQVTYVPMDLFKLLGNGVDAKENVISFTKENDEMTQIPNPMKKHETLKAAAEAAKVKLGTMPTIPAAYSDVTYYAIGDSMLHVVYQSGDSRIIFRAQAGEADISGDWTVYSEVKTMTIGAHTVTTKGDNGKISLAMWQADGQSYALSSDAAMSAETLTEMLKG